MKTKLFAALFAISFLFSAAAAQSVTVTRKKVTYTRPKPMSEYKKTFVVNYPKVHASSPAISRKIEKALNYEKVLGINIKDELHDTQWLEEADYKVEYNKNNFLGISLFMEGSGAYPSGSTRYVSVDTRSGAKLRPADLFTNLPGLTAMVKKAQVKEIAQAKAGIKRDPENGSLDDEFADAAKYHPLKLDEFTISGKGVTFHYDYGFPHVILALQPAGEFFFPWRQLRTYIRPGGLLAPIAR